MTWDKPPTRSQLVSMVATLRGSLISLMHGHIIDRESDLDDAQQVLDATGKFPYEEGDLVDGGFDKSWFPENMK